MKQKIEVVVISIIMSGVLFILMLMLLFMSVLLTPGASHGAMAFIPLKHHYQAAPKWYQKLFGKTPNKLIVEVKAHNDKDKNIDIRAAAEIIEIDRTGNIVMTGKFLQVKPETITLFPDNTRTFSIIWELPPQDGSIIVHFTITAGDYKGAGFHLSSTTGYSLLLSRNFEHHKPEPTLEVDRERNRVIVTNDSKTGFEGALYLLNNEGEYKNASRHFFITGETSREIEMSLGNNVSGVILDYGAKTRIGRRLGEQSDKQSQHVMAPSL